MPTYLGKLTSYMSQDDRSAKKKSYNVTVTQLEGQTCHPPNPHFGWRPFTSWICLQSEHVFARYAFLISSQSSFRLVTVFDSWICMKSDHVFTSEGFFSDFVPILISAGGILTNWICSQSDHVFAVEGFLISFLSSLWQECRYASKTTNLKQLLLTSKFTF